MELEKNDKLNTVYLSAQAEYFLRDFQNSFSALGDLKNDNDKKVGTALVYEKIRVALEYQEEHLIFKNAISRILRRKYALNSNISSAEATSDLISELAWANYLNPELISNIKRAEIKLAIERYLILLKYVRSGRFSGLDLQKMIIDWLACEVQEKIMPSKENEVLLNYVYSIMIQSLNLNDIRITEEDAKIQVMISINSLLLKPDFHTIEFWTLRAIYPNWQELPAEELKKIARSFDPYYNKIDRALNHPFKKNFSQFVKKNIAPFILIRKVITTKNLEIDNVREKPAIIQNIAMEEYDNMTAAARKKVWRGTFRALIFILITKMSLAFLVEIPFDRFFSGGIDYQSLIINVSLPPFLMFLAGTFIKSPSEKNKKVVRDAIMSILTKDKVDDKRFDLVRKRSNTFEIFNAIYFLFTLLILAGVIWLLIFLKFNVVSTTLFFFFVSAVSFFSFRIRNIALELAMKRSRDDALTSIVELVFMPFIRLGKFFSDKIASFNPLILALDFLIEAPMKTIIKILNSWFKFVNSKKEDLEV